jgi:hypothetical protein
LAQGIDGKAADVGLTDLEHRHISELHELAAAAGVPRFRTLRRAELAAAINAALQADAEVPQAVETGAAVPQTAETGAAVQQPAETPAAVPQPPETTAAQTLFAIIRVARGSRWTPAPKPDQVQVERIVSTEEEAEREVERLSALAQSQQTGATYFWRAASVEPS